MVIYGLPGYWAYDNDSGDYYWVPGVWVAPPTPGYLWTPAYWGYDGGVYGFHPGYWGRHVGFYGGINYGYGYGGVGFGGGAWSGNTFRYNTAVVNVNTTVVHNTYVDKTVIVNNVTVNNHNSFNGPGGVTAKPRPEELAAMKEQHVPPTSQQQSHEHTASQDKSQFASVNHGRPNNAAMNKVGGSHFTPEGQKAPRTNNNGNRPNNNAANAGHQNNDATKQPITQQGEHANNNAATHDDAAKATNAEKQDQQQAQQQHAQQQQHNQQQQHVQQQHTQQQHKQQPQHKSAPRPHAAPKHEK